MSPALTRREFLATSACGAVSAAMGGAAAAPAAAQEPIIDIHQHTHYSGRTNPQLFAHQRAMGATLTVLLPAGRFYGLDAQCGGNDSVMAVAREQPGEFVCFANEVADIEEAPTEIRKYLRRGAIGIGEQKFRVGCDSAFFERIAALAAEFNVPVLMHFQHQVYNTDIGNFHKTLEKFPKANFIGHAQTWWGNVDAKLDQTVLYPSGKVTPGGITDRLLADYPNIFGDMSAGSGLNHLVRDPDHAAAFIARHQDKLLFGSDCDDGLGRGPGCAGAQIIANIRKLAPGKSIERKLLFENARKLLGPRLNLRGTRSG
jgi:predicted TIM-barrel fold metal-dependent hydrolase